MENPSNLIKSINENTNALIEHTKTMKELTKSLKRMNDRRLTDL